MEKQTNNRKHNNKQPQPFRTVYSPCQITKKITLPIHSIGKNLAQTLESTISQMICGKCIVEGYVKPNSVKLLTFSSGVLKGATVTFEVVFNCEVCYPVAGMIVNCVATNITKAGILAESSDETPTPFVFYVLRDQFFSNDYFNSIEEGDNFLGKVIMQRFELNDKFVTIVGEPVKDRNDMNFKKPKLVL